MANPARFREEFALLLGFDEGEDGVGEADVQCVERVIEGGKLVEFVALLIEKSVGGLGAGDGLLVKLVDVGSH